MENRFKLRLSRIFQSSFASCRSRDLSDIIEKAVFDPQKYQSFRETEPPTSPKARAFPSICRPGPSETTESIVCQNSVNRTLLGRRCSGRNSDGRTCPPASPISPLKSSPAFGSEANKQSDNKSVKDMKKTKKKKKKKTQKKKKKSKDNMLCPFSSSSLDTNFGGSWWYSSSSEDEGDEKEDETETLFSSKSLSSDSSEFQRRKQRSRQKNQASRRRSGALSQSSEMSLLPLRGKVKDSFAVVKKSSDPYNDFRTSMVEMIVEKQIFAAKDLEHLLQCFLSLNSSRHHRVIVEVFTEIWEALFSDWGS